jgi:hypothetical protein
MKPIRLTFASLILVTVFTSTALGQNNRSFVSGLGSDSNPCSRTAPCRTFAQAISQTNAGGEVIALDSAGYGTCSIDKSLTLEAPPGVYAGITVSGGTGISISNSTPGTTILVNLRGLTIQKSAPPVVAVMVDNCCAANQNVELHIAECAITSSIASTSQGGGGILFTSFTDTSRLFVERTTIDNFVVGIQVGTGFATIDGVRFKGNGVGVSNFFGSVSISNSIITGSCCGAIGTGTSSPPTGVGETNIENCVISNNAEDGIDCQNGGLIRISNTTITKNGGVGVSQSGTGVILSRGNNTIEGNGTNVSGTLGTYSAK